MAEELAVCRLGMIVPSSNTVFEPEAARLVSGLGGISLHVSRARVMSISLAEWSVAQFDPRPMANAASLLADAGVDLVVWAGTSGTWLGLDHDQRVVDAILESTGIAATTSTAALLEACRKAPASRISLVTPYEPAIVERIVATFASQGIEVVSERHLGIRDNYLFGTVSPETVQEMVVASAADEVDAVVVSCTNLRGASNAPGLERSGRVPVIDSIAATISHAVQMARRPGARHQANGH